MRLLDHDDMPRYQIEDPLIAYHRAEREEMARREQRFALVFCLTLTAVLVGSALLCLHFNWTW